MDEILPTLDILYMTRVQKERFFNEADYIRLKDTYIFNQQKLEISKPDLSRLKDTYILNMTKLAKAKKDLSILHPLPRVNEIAPSIDDDPRACYFEQARNGKYIRMALIMKLLEVSV